MDADKRVYSSIVSEMVHILKALQIVITDYGVIYYLYKGIPYRAMIDIHTPQNLYIGQCLGDGCLGNVTENIKKEILDAYQQALNSYLLQVHAKRNAQYLPTPLKDYLLTLLN